MVQFMSRKKKQKPEPVIEVFTFDEWKARGFHVNKGEKSTSRNADGVCVFTRQQVSENTKKYTLREYDNYDYEFDHDMGFDGW